MKVSVIIPAYNAEKWIERCLESVINQSYQNIEIIVVNDGSLDNTLNILNNYAEKDNRIIVIDKENTGTYDTRRTGLMRSIGEAIFNADADDFLEPNAIELLANKFKIEEADVVIGNSYQVLNGKKRVVRNKIPLQQNKTAFLRSLLNNDIKGYLWGRLYKRDLLKNMDYQLSNLLQEDTLANLHIFANNDLKIALEETPIYNYVIHPNSANSNRNSEFIENVYNFNQITEKILKDSGLFKELTREFELFKCRNWIVYARLGGKLAKDRRFRKEFYRKNFTFYVRTNLPFYNYGEMIAYRYSNRVGQSLTKAMKTINSIVYQFKLN